MKRQKLERMENRVYTKSVTRYENMTCTDWNRLFSEKELHALDRFYRGKVFCHFNGDSYELKEWPWAEKYREAEQIWNRTFQQDEKDREISIPSPHFPVFYRRLFQFAYNLLLASTDGWEKDTVTLLWESLLPDLESQYTSCSLRILIREMHRLKAQGLLTAADPQKEYARFEQEYVNQFPYYLDLFDRYPVMWGLVIEKTVHFINSRVEAWKNHEKDREQIAEKLRINKGTKLISIQGGQSDLHHSGQSVLTFLYENGMRILYKPRSLKNEQVFQKILHWFSLGTGISQRCYQIIDQTTYGWEEWIPTEECQSEGEVKAFYKRTGQLLFLAYLFSINDMHQENLLAAGEFPVIVDLETFLQSRKNRPRVDAGGQAENRILNSVLATGILPFYTGDDDGNAAILSALGDAAPQKSWVKVPVIEKPGTSAMHIGYRHIPIRQTENVPALNGIRKGAAAYKDFIIQGFDRTYQFAVSHLNELLFICKGLKNIRSRVVLRPTQLYAMYLNTSCHPVFLTDIADREIFLGQLLNGISGDTPSEEIIQKEIDDLLQGDIPVFYSDEDSRWLLDRDGKKIIPYFSQTGYELLLEKTDSLCENDRKQQIRFIQMSLELIENDTENIAGKKQILNHKESPLKEAVRSIYEVLEKTSVKDINATEVTWINAYRTASAGKKWELRPCDIYLYDGVAGIAQFVLGYESIMGNAPFYLGELVKNTLFAYTDRTLEDPSLLHTENTGAFAGEGSLIHAYLSLYAISGEREFLIYAEKHVPILETLLQGDTSYDLLSGNAGAILVLLQLFRTTRKEKYLALAENAAGILLKHKTETESGAGWIIKGQEQILAGLSHGESGFALAFYHLYRETGKKRYGDIVKKILAYEDHLYSVSHNNWPDYRGRKPGESGGDLAAWCHGAAGILVARHQMADMGFQNIYRDKANAVRKTMEALDRKGWCLCHGKLGNALILQEVLGNDFHTDLWDTAARIVLEGKLDAIEKYHMDFMTGIPGIGFGLLTQMDKNLKADILLCKSVF